MSDNKRVWNEASQLGDMTKPYTVSFWEENPTPQSKLGEVSGNDTCWMAEDFATEKEARLAMADLDAHFPPSHRDIPFILLDGPNGLHEITCRTEVLKRREKERKEDDNMARRERAMEAGMGLGIHAYNEVMGYDSEPYEPEIHDIDDYQYHGRFGDDE